MPRPRNKLTDEISKKVGVSKRQAERLAQGANAAKKAGNEPLAETFMLRLRKLRAEVEKLEFGNQVAKGEYTANASVREAFIRIAAAVKGELMRFENELPATLTGLNEAEMQIKIRASCDALLGRLAEMSP